MATYVQSNSNSYIHVWRWELNQRPSDNKTLALPVSLSCHKVLYSMSVCSTVQGQLDFHVVLSAPPAVCLAQKHRPVITSDIMFLQLSTEGASVVFVWGKNTCSLFKLIRTNKDSNGIVCNSEKVKRNQKWLNGRSIFWISPSLFDATAERIAVWTKQAFWLQLLSLID